MSHHLQVSLCDTICLTYDDFQISLLSASWLSLINSPCTVTRPPSQGVTGLGRLTHLPSSLGLSTDLAPSSSWGEKEDKG